MDLQKLQDAVAAETTIDQSAITLLNNLSAQLKGIANDPAAVNALADQLSAQSTALAAAVAANTPATTDPAPTPTA